MAETLNTDRTISAWVAQYRLPGDEDGMIHECRVLLNLGPGVNGHPDICHGGFVAVVLDEVMGLLLVVNEERNRALGERGSGGRQRFRGPVFTASLKVDYGRPCPTPGVVLARALLTRVEGRKRFVNATLEDGRGGVYARGEGVFVAVRENL
jgi:thioesterase superfamily protein 4